MAWSFDAVPSGVNKRNVRRHMRCGVDSSALHQGLLEATYGQFGFLEDRSCRTHGLSVGAASTSTLIYAHRYGRSEIRNGEPRSMAGLRLSHCGSLPLTLLHRIKIGHGCVSHGHTKT